MIDVVVVLTCALLVVAVLAYARLWLTEVGDLLWMAGLKGWIVLGAIGLVGLVINLLSLWMLPVAGLTATRFALVVVLAPYPARRLADAMAWLRLPKDERGRFKVGAIFEQASAAQQSEFIQSLAEQDGAAATERWDQV